MPHRRITTLLTLAACALTPAVAGAQATSTTPTTTTPTSTVPAAPLTALGTVTLTPLTKSTSLAAYRRTELFSRWDGSAYHLAVITGGEVRDLDVPTQAKPFDGDVGPTPSGTPEVVYSQCTDSCDLFVIGLDPGDTPRPVTNANTTDHDEVAPAIALGRLVFGRRYSKDLVLPYTKKLVAPRSTPSTRLAGLPKTRCGAFTGASCRPIKDVTLEHMDLEGRWVGQSWTYQPDGFPGFRQNEIRLTDTSRTHTTQIARMTTGEGGQTYLGPTVAAAQVFFFRGCQGDPGGCKGGTSGVVRYSIGGSSASIIAGNDAWSGWAADGTWDYHVPSDFDCSGGDTGAAPTEPCGIVQRFLGTAFTPIDPQKLR